VTRNDKTGEVVSTVKKIRIGNLDVYNPKRAADWRISVNVEVPGVYPYSLAPEREQVLSASFSTTSLGFANALTSKGPHQLYS